ncbi:MAG: zf-HC2 domain-containing protein [Deltaproteobacteria bacterium]|nr:zf-HC2 domain-containing protein [Deltaproteobacteria bacterium]
MGAEKLQIEHCKDCVDLLGDYVEGSLPAEKAAALEQHLSRCMPCVTFVRTYKATSSVARQSLNHDMPQELVASLHDFLGNAIPGFKSCSPDKGCSTKKRGGGENT